MKQVAALYASEAGKATWSRAFINDLPDGAFACINESGRHYPHHGPSGALDLPHLRAALSRIGDPTNEQCGKGHLQAHAKSAGVGEAAGKALLPVKAQPMDDSELAAWFAGKVPRRLLAIPFGGPLPTPHYAKGMDLDREFFTERTNIYGSFPALRETPERLLDWHHAQDKLMGKTIIGKTILNPDPDEDGWWVDAWLKAGEERLAMVRRLVERGAQLFGSSLAAYKKALPTGEITEWPMILETLTTSPQNTLSVLAPMKALLDQDVDMNPTLTGLLSSLEALSVDLAPTSDAGEDTAKAGRGLSALKDALDADVAAWRSLRH